MVLRVQGFQAFTRHMGVDGGGGNVGVTQQHLHGLRIGPVVEPVPGRYVASAWQVRGKVVAQGVAQRGRGACG